MRYFKVIAIAVLVLAAAAIGLVNGCGDKLSLPSDLPDPVYGGVDTNYIVVNPIWTEFNGRALARPGDVYIGYDQLVYICDTENDRVVKLGIDGTFISEYPVVHPVAITQDRGLDLLVVCGDYSRTVIDGNDTTEVSYGDSVFRKRYLGNQAFERVFEAPYPYDFDRDRPVRAQFWSVEASDIEAKTYYVADFWKGQILEFDKNDNLVIPRLEKGIAIGKTRYPLDLCSYRIAGQSYIALAQGAGNLDVQIFSLPNWISPYADVDSLPPLIRFQANRYIDVTVDELSNFYVLLNEPDPTLGAYRYFYKFDRRGESLLQFGTFGSGNKQFNNPQGIDYFEGIIFIADSGNNRVVRYQLATDTQQ